MSIRVRIHIQRGVNARNFSKTSCRSNHRQQLDHSNTRASHPRPHTPTRNNDKNSLNMFEARLKQGHILKKVLDSIKDLVTDANFEADPVEGFKLQAMDSSHVSLVSLKLHKEGFEHYTCQNPLTMGMNLANMVRIDAPRRASFDAPAPFRVFVARSVREAEDVDPSRSRDARNDGRNARHSTEFDDNKIL